MGIMDHCNTLGAGSPAISTSQICPTSSAEGRTPKSPVAVGRARCWRWTPLNGGEAHIMDTAGTQQGNLITPGVTSRHRQGKLITPGAQHAQQQAHSVALAGEEAAAATLLAPLIALQDAVEFGLIPYHLLQIGPCKLQVSALG